MRPAQSRWYAAAALGIALAAVGGWYHARQASPPQTSPGGRAEGAGVPGESLQEENSRLRREVASLKTQLAGIRDQGKGPSTAGPGAGMAASLPEAPGIPAEELLAKAQAALKSGDANAFVDAFDALMAAGEGAYPGIIALVQEIEDWAIFFRFRNLEDLEVHQRYLRNILIRAPQLRGLLDAILLREGKPDRATQFAMALFVQGATSGLPRERQIAILLGLLASPEGDERPGRQIHRRAAEILATCLKATEAIPELERLYLAASENERQDLLGAWPVSGPGCAASLKRLLDRSQDDLDRARLIQYLGRIEGAEANETLWSIAQSGGAAEQASSLEALAARPENVDRIIQQELKNPQLPRRQRLRLLDGLMQSAQEDEAAKQRLWELYDNDPSFRDDLMSSFLPYEGSRARQILGDSLRAGQVSDAWAQHLSFLDAGLLREHAGTLKAMAANPQGTLQARMGAYRALYSVDRSAATDALLTGFAGLSEEDRIEVLMTATYNSADDDDAILQRLRQIAESDPSPKVKEAMKEFDNP